MLYSTQDNNSSKNQEDKMDFDFSSDLLTEARILAVEMAKNGEKIREMKVGEFGQVFLSSDEELVKWIQAFKSGGAMFYIGAKK